MKKLLLLLAFCIPKLLVSQSSGVYVTNIQLLNKAEKWCWSISQDDDQNIYDGVNQNLVETPITPLNLKYDNANKKVWLSGNETVGVLEPTGYAHYNFKLLSTRYNNEFNKIHLLNDTVYFISDSVILRYDALSLEKIDELYSNNLIIDEVIEYKNKLYFIIDYFLYTISDSKLVEVTDADYPVDEFAYSVSVDSNTLILGTSSNTIYSHNGKTYRSYDLSSPFFKNNQVTNGYYYNDSTIIVSSLAGGIALIDFNKKKVINQIGYFNGLPDDEIRTIFIDKQKGIWLSHEFGISRVDLKLGIENYSYYPGLKGNPIAINYFKNHLYVATNDGLFMLDEIKDYNEFKVKVTVPVNVAVEIPVEVAQEPVVVETTDNNKKGFFMFKSKKRRKKSANANANIEYKKEIKPTRTQTKVVHKTKIIKKRSLKSISHYFKQVKGMSGKFTQLVPFNNFLLVAGNNGLYAVNGKRSESIIKNRYIVDIYISDCCDVAFCCTNNGLYKVFRKNNRWEIDHFAQTTSAYINSVVYDKDDKWVLAFDNMLFRGEIENKKINLLQEVEMPENTGQTFTLKNINDSIYVFTSSKIYHFNDNGELNLIQNLNLDSYLIQRQNNYTWLYNDGSWDLFANNKSKINSTLINRMNLFGTIRDIRLNNENELWIIDDENQLFKFSLEEEANLNNFNISLINLSSNSELFDISETVELGSKHNNLTAKFSAPFYLLQNGVEFSYFIDGLNSNWSTWTPQSEINIGFIPPGNYTLAYKAKNTLGDETGSGKINIKVPKPFTQTFFFYFLLLIIFSLIAYVIFKIRLQKLKKDKQILEQKVKERTATIEHQKSEIEKQHDEITQSIRYAKRIQTAMLPHDEIIDAMLPKHFILFNPRDIVSGDFYFFKPLGNKIVFVAADCTGHGVPGGFMSMLGISYLSEITSQLKEPSAAEIINHLREKIKLTLGQTDEGSTQKDGMDLAICVIDTDKKQIQYSGAYNPLYLIRKGELDIIKADRQPVAVYFKESSFTNHIVDVKPGDKFYMFSDGYPDQIGGPKQRKFMTKNFKTLLLDNHHLPMEEQKQVLQDAINEWKGDSMQIDDILVVGFEL